MGQKTRQTSQKIEVAAGRDRTGEETDERENREVAAGRDRKGETDEAERETQSRGRETGEERRFQRVADSYPRRDRFIAWARLPLLSPSYRSCCSDT